MDMLIFISQFIGFIVLGTFIMYVVVEVVREAYIMLYGLVNSFKSDIKDIHIGDSSTKILLISLYNKGYRYVRLLYHEDGKNSLQVAISQDLGYCDDVYVDDYIALQLYSACIADTIPYAISDVIDRL